MAKARVNYSRPNGMVVVGHESPYRFDQFSLDHMGKGEGAQAYSKGLYFWENPSVGGSYADSFSHHPAVLTPEWKRWSQQNHRVEDWDYYDAMNRSPYNPSLISMMQDYYPAPEPAYLLPHNREAYSDTYKRIFSEPQRESLLSAFNGMPGYPFDKADFKSFELDNASGPYYNLAYDYLGDIALPEGEQANKLRNHFVNRALIGDPGRAALERFHTAVGAVGRPMTLRDVASANPDWTREQWVSNAVRHFPVTRVELPPRPVIGPEPKKGPFSYHVNLHADRSAFPDLNTAIGAQPSHLQDALLDFAATRSPELDEASRKWLTLNNLRSSSFTRPPGETTDPRLGSFSSGLAQRGIPGVRYDDYTRNTLGPDEGRTQNFVVYDPSIIEIAKRYPFSLLAPALLAEGAKEQQTPVQSPLAGSLLQ